jgi:YD repeat-containing protein
MSISSISTTEYTSFDILGRVTGHKQTTDGTDYVTGYTYNLSGALIEETYPSGRVVGTLDWFLIRERICLLFRRPEMENGTQAAY